MVDLLGDLYLMEAFLQSEKIGVPNYEDTVIYYYAGLFQKHGVTREVFREALSCYLLYEREIQEIHEEIMQRLSMLDSEIKYEADMIEQALQKASADSLTYQHASSPALSFGGKYPWWHTVAAHALPYVEGGWQAATVTNTFSPGDLLHETLPADSLDTESPGSIESNGLLPESER